MSTTTTKEEYDARRVTLTKPHLGSFLNLDEARKVKRNGKEVGEAKYSTNIEFELDAEDLATIRAKIVSQARGKWPNLDVGAAIKAGDLKVPLENGDKLADKATAKGKAREWSRGKMVLTARSQNQPQVGIISGGKIVTLEDKASIVAHKAGFLYTGVKVHAELDFVAYDAVDDDAKPGVTCYLSSILSTGKGEKLIKGRDLKEAFSGYVGLESAEDPSGGDAGTDW